MSNTEVAKKSTFSAFVNATSTKRAIMNALQDENRARRFTASIVSAVNANPALAECDSVTIISGALLGESLNLSPSPQLGQYYLVPFNDNKRGCKVAQFQLGYKGYIQLAIRSGEYRKLNVLAIKEGELVRFDPLNEEIEVNLIEDEIERENTPTVGYYAMFEYTNGFRKAIYWSREKMEAHADKFSAAFNAKTFEKLRAGEIPEKDRWKYSSFWYKDFDAMAYKTMLRQLISKWGIMSIEMQDVITKDDGVLRENNAVEFIADTVESSPIVQQDEPNDAEKVTMDEL